ncbi:MAG: hypothetical protein OEZ57_01825 [Nitrospirota bacterium]|nr:hypothetical protein [Nitrospirota bacterium]
MNLFPIHQPNLALSISGNALYLVESKKSWRTTTLKRVKEVWLPPDVLHLSSAKPNIEKMDVFIEHLRTLTESIKKPVSIALSLPDLCARTCVFDFSTFPTKKFEQLALLNWRFQQDLKLDTTQSRLDYGVYLPSSLTETSKEETNPENVRILGTAIRNEIVEQYERACLDLNLMPVSVSIAGLDIFDLYQPTIKEILEVKDRRKPSKSSEAMFLFISHWGFTFFAFEEGCPRFIRTKAITIRPNASLGGEDASTGSPNHENVGAKSLQALPTLINAEGPHTGDSATHPYPFYTANKVEKEILATLQYYLETFSQHDAEPSLANLFVVSDLEHGQKLLPTSEQLQQTAKVSGLSVSDIQVTKLSSSTHFHRRGSTLHESSMWSALPGYASLRVA